MSKPLAKEKDVQVIQQCLIEGALLNILQTVLWRFASHQREVVFKQVWQPCMKRRKIVSKISNLSTVNLSASYLSNPD